MKRRSVHTISAFAFLVAFLYIQLCLPYTSHAHIINGTKIVHAHPSSNDKGHSHDEGALFVIDTANHQVFLTNCDILVPEISVITWPKPAQHEIAESSESVFAGIPLHRGPPFCKS